MTRLLLPRVLDAVELGTQDAPEPVGVAVIALDSRDDLYLCIDRSGASRWVSMADVRICDDAVRSASGRGEDMASRIAAERMEEVPLIA